MIQTVWGSAPSSGCSPDVTQQTDSTWAETGKNPTAFDCMYVMYMHQWLAFGLNIELPCSRFLRTITTQKYQKCIQ